MLNKSFAVLVTTAAKSFVRAFGANPAKVDTQSQSPAQAQEAFLNSYYPQRMSLLTMDDGQWQAIVPIELAPVLDRIFCVESRWEPMRGGKINDKSLRAELLFMQKRACGEN